MRLVSISPLKWSGDYRVFDTIVAKGDHEVKKMIYIGGIAEKVSKNDSFIDYQAARALREARRDIAVEATGDPFAYESEDMSACVAETVAKIRGQMCA